MKKNKIIELENPPDEFRLTKLKGWLLFYFFVTAFLIVISSGIAIGLLKSLNFSLIPKESTLIILELILIIFQIYALALIFEQKKKAIIFNIIVLWAYFILVLILGNTANAIGGFMWAVIWTLYFNTAEAKRILIN